MTEPCPRCKGTGCITDTSIACRGCCPDCQPPSAHETPEHAAEVRPLVDGLPAKRTTWTTVIDTALGLEHDGDEEPQHGNRGLGGWQCTCGRFAKFLRWQNTGAPGWERGYVVNCTRCGEVLVY